MIREWIASLTRLCHQYPVWIAVSIVVTIVFSVWTFAIIVQRPKPVKELPKVAIPIDEYLRAAQDAYVWADKVCWDGENGILLMHFSDKEPAEEARGWWIVEGNVFYKFGNGTLGYLSDEERTTRVNSVKTDGLKCKDDGARR